MTQSIRYVMTRGMTDRRSQPIDGEKPGDEVPPGTEGSGPNICPSCSGSGEVDGRRCENCRGTGRVQEAVGGG